MIDHASIGVRDLAAALRFYQPLLAALDMRLIIQRETDIGFGKTYPEFWLNARPELAIAADNGCHIALRCGSIEMVHAFYDLALGLGASTGGEPGFRPQYRDSYYAAFIRDADNNHIEVVTFVQQTPAE